MPPSPLLARRAAVAIEPGLSSLELTDLDDPDGAGWDTVGDARIDIDGTNVSSQATFSDPADGEEVTGSLEAVCP